MWYFQKKKNSLEVLYAIFLSVYFIVKIYVDYVKGGDAERDFATN